MNVALQPEAILGSEFSGATERSMGAPKTRGYGVVLYGMVSAMVGPLNALNSPSGAWGLLITPKKISGGARNLFWGSSAI